jgi:hypothetical protein
VPAASTLCSASLLLQSAPTSKSSALAFWKESEVSSTFGRLDSFSKQTYIYIGTDVRYLAAVNTICALKSIVLGS